MSEPQQMPVKPVQLRAFSLEEASQILEKQDPTQLPQWQMHGPPIFGGTGVIQVMMLLDRIKPPTIITPQSGLHLVR